YVPNRGGEGNIAYGVGLARLQNLNTLKVVF
ncbi:unnamed protein product, partial [marine sediment metagenome]